MTVAVSVPERFNAAAFFLDRHLAEGRGDRIAFRYRGRNVTYAEVATRASRAAGALRARGVDIEQRVLLALPDCPQFAEAFWGAIHLGAVPVPLDPGLRAADYAFFVEDSRARAVVTHPAIAADFLAAPCRGGRRPPVLVVGAPPSDAESYEDALAAAASVGEPADTSRDDVALWSYTSGSTGRPKAAVHLQRDLVCAAELVGRGIFGIGPDDLILSASKLFFAFGLGNSLYFPALAGAASVLIPERLDPEDLLAMVAAERPTHLFAVATVYARLLQVPDAARRFDLGSLRICVSSGESLPAGVYQGWRDRFGLELLDVVGSTEALHDYLANRPGASRAGASGQVIPGFEARLVDGEGRPVLPGATGELWIKGESTATGYWNRHAESRRTMQGEWLRTGDMYYQDTDGYFYFQGRGDDMLKVGGVWVSPVEVEGCLAEHPAVREAGVIGRRDADGLIRAHAFCVLREGVAGDAALTAALTEHVRRRLAGYKSPRWLDFVDALPKTSTGKLQRFRLRAAAAAP
jgi:benzoate-CoA ligase family protein